MLDKQAFENFAKTYIDLLCLNHPARESLCKTKKATVRKICRLYTKASNDVLGDLRKSRKSAYQYMIAGDVDGLCKLLTESEAEGLLLIMKGDSDG